MRQKLLIAVALSVLVATAGCSSLFGGADNVPTETADGTPVATDTSTVDDSPTPTATPETDLSPEEYPAGYSPTGVSNPESALDSHQSALAASGSWVTMYSTSYTGNNSAMEFTELSRVNHSEMVQLRNLSLSSGGTQTTYLTESEGWQRASFEDYEPWYTYAADGYNATEATHAPVLKTLLGSVEYTENSTYAENGTVFVAYDVTGLTEGSSLAPNPENGTELTDLTGSFSVSTSGAISEFTFSATSVSPDQPDSTMLLRLTYDDLGETIVDEPNWLEDAKNETSNSAPSAPTTSP